VPTAVAQLVSGHEHSCVLLRSGSVKCWGWNPFGGLGYGNTETIGDDELPSSVGAVDVGGPVASLGAGSAYTCALLTSGAVRCWGYNFYGQLGLGHKINVGDDELPSAVNEVNVGGAVVQMAVGFLHTCVLLDTGAVRCWGANDTGQLGYGNTRPIGDNEVPASAGDVDVGGTVVQLSAGVQHTCALLDTGAVRCWGSGGAGQLGYGNVNTIGDDETPASAGDVDVGGPVAAISARNTFRTCALLVSGGVRCWGAEFLGALGYGNLVRIGDDEPPAAAGDVNVGGVAVAVETATAHTCAVLASGAVRCWGSGNLTGYGNSLNIGDDEVPATAGDVAVGGTVASLATGTLQTCALLDSGDVRCWGNGGMGALGYGNTNTIGDDEVPASVGPVDIF
jgi:alpha-tubulin suppressor-like RCC1 family protein